MRTDGIMKHLTDSQKGSPCGMCHVEARQYRILEVVWETEGRLTVASTFKDF